MPRGSWILHDGRMVPAAEYWAMKAAEVADVRTGSPMLITDWPDSVVTSDGTVLSSREDQRQYCSRMGYECVGSDLGSGSEIIDRNSADLGKLDFSDVLKRGIDQMRDGVPAKEIR